MSPTYKRWYDHDPLLLEVIELLRNYQPELRAQAEIFLQKLEENLENDIFGQNDAVQKLSVDVGIPTKLEALKEEDLDFLAESAHADACAPGNPKDASVEDLKALFRKLM